MPCSTARAASRWRRPSSTSTPMRRSAHRRSPQRKSMPIAQTRAQRSRAHRDAIDGQPVRQPAARPARHAQAGRQRRPGRQHDRQPAREHPARAAHRVQSPDRARVAASARCRCRIDEVKRVARGFGVSLNDVVMAICSGALRELLLTVDALPKKSLVAAMPVSLARVRQQGRQQPGLDGAVFAGHRRRRSGRSACAPSTTPPRR